MLKAFDNISGKLSINVYLPAVKSGLSDRRARTYNILEFSNML